MDDGISSITTIFFMKRNFYWILHFFVTTLVEPISIFLFRPIPSLKPQLIQVLFFTSNDPFGSVYPNETHFTTIISENKMDTSSVIINIHKYVTYFCLYSKNRIEKDMGPCFISIQKKWKMKMNSLNWNQKNNNLKSLLCFFL